MSCSARASCFWRYALVREATTAAKCPLSAVIRHRHGRSRPPQAQAAGMCRVGPAAAAAGVLTRELSRGCSCEIGRILVQNWPSLKVMRATPIQGDVWYRIGVRAHAHTLSCARARALRAPRASMRTPRGLQTQRGHKELPAAGRGDTRVTPREGPLRGDL